MSTPDCTTPTKTCTTCGSTYPATTEFFHRNKKGKHGLHARCKTCTSDYMRKRHLKDPQKSINTTREWQRKNPEKVRDQNRNWYKNNPDRARKKSREWRKRNPDRARASDQQKRTRKRSLPNTITCTDIRNSYEYFHNCCAVCGHQLNNFFIQSHLDHWIPISSPDCPGSIPTNMVPLCAHCNQNKHNSNPIDWLMRVFGNKKAMVIHKRISVYFSTLIKELD